VPDRKTLIIFSGLMPQLCRTFWMFCAISTTTRSRSWYISLWLRVHVAG